MGTGVSLKRIATRVILLFLLVRRLSPIHKSFGFMNGAPDLLYICFIRSASASQLARGPIRICALGSQQPNSNPTLTYSFLRKEVIQPHLPIRLPCYDFTPVIRPAFDGSFLTVRSPASGISDSHGVTGGVYKTRERIHRSILICDY